MSATGQAARFYAQLGARALSALVASRVLAPDVARPARLGRMLAALGGGFSPATAVRLGAARHPERAAVIDDRGAVTFAELEARSAALAAALARDHGVGPARGLGVMCRNHRGFVEALLAGARLGADVLLLNTEFPGPQLAQALARHPLGAIIVDDELESRFTDAGCATARIIAWAGHDDPPGRVTLDALAAAPVTAPPPPATRRGKIVILTSGTTGAPRGAARAPSLRALLGPLTTLLSTIGLRAGEPLLVAPPLFHGFGLAWLGLALFLGSPLVLRRKFDPETLLADVARQRVATVVVVPLMLRRLLDLPAPLRRRYAAPSLRAVLSAGAPLDGQLALDFMDAFGDVVYNLYGSTETGFGAIATPADLRAAPGTVGRAPFGTRLAILDEARAPAAAGSVGWIFVGGPMVFDGYSGGGSKERAGGLMNSGDLGHLDGAGRLFVDGREDDMIVSGGENVFPREVEEELARHPSVREVAVIGVPDAEFGQRLRAFVVARAAAPTADELRAWVKASLARYKVPRDFVFVDELPRNAVGKVLRAQLPTCRDAAG